MQLLLLRCALRRSGLLAPKRKKMRIERGGGRRENGLGPSAAGCSRKIVNREYRVSI